MRKVPKTNELSDPDNFNMVNEAAKTDNVDLEHGEFYAFIEKWQSHNTAEECASDFSHVRLVVGQYMNKQRRDGWLKASRSNSYTYGGKVKPGVVKEGSNTHQQARKDVKHDFRVSTIWNQFFQNRES